MTSKLQPPIKTRKEKQNSNCLDGMQCPKCKSLEPFSIQCHCIVQVFDNGTDVTSDHEWDENSFCSCDKCHFSASVKEFEVKGKQSKGVAKP